MVQWLGICAFTAEGAGSIPGWGTKIPNLCGMAKSKTKSWEGVCVSENNSLKISRNTRCCWLTIIYGTLEPGCKVKEPYMRWRSFRFCSSLTRQQTVCFAVSASGSLRELLLSLMSVHFSPLSSRKAHSYFWRRILQEMTGTATSSQCWLEFVSTNDSASVQREMRRNPSSHICRWPLVCCQGWPCDSDLSMVTALDVRKWKE